MNCKFLLFVTLALSLSIRYSFAQIIPPPQISKDTPAEAQTVSVGVCDINFVVDATFNNSAIGVTAPCTGTAVGAIQEDAWAKFTTPAVGGNFVIRYNNTNQDAAVMVYNDTGAGAPGGLAGCINAVGGPGTESLILTLAANTNYWIRIGNVGFTEGMNGTLCLFRQYNSDTQATAAAAPSLPLGSCNVQFDITGADSGFGDVTGCAITPSVTNNRDGWVKLDLTTGQNIAVEYQSDNASNHPGIVVYYDNGGTIQLDLNIAFGGIQTSCYNGAAPANSSFGKVDFTVAQTGTYYVRVLNMANTNPMEGSLCIGLV